LLSEKKTKIFYESQIGKVYPVLWESRRNGDNMVGFTNNYIRVERPFNKNLVNIVEEVNLGEWNNDKSSLLII